MSYTCADLPFTTAYHHDLNDMISSGQPALVSGYAGGGKRSKKRSRKVKKSKVRKSRKVKRSKVRKSRKVKRSKVRRSKKVKRSRRR